MRRLFWNTKDTVSISSSLGTARTSAPPMEMLPLCSVEEPAHKARKRRLAAARGADERHCLPGPNVHRDALYDLRLAVVAEVYVLKLHRAVLRVLRLDRSTNTGSASSTESIRLSASATIILFSLMYMIFVSVREMTGVMMM